MKLESRRPSQAQAGQDGDAEAARPRANEGPPGSGRGLGPL